MKKTEQYQVRHGDVFLRPVALPQGARPQQVAEQAVLAYGEVTGHAHRVETEGRIDRLTHDGRAYLLLEQAGVLTHEEHGRIPLAAGAYEVITERDYDPSVHARRVVD